MKIHHGCPAHSNSNSANSALRLYRADTHIALCGACMRISVSTRRRCSIRSVARVPIEVASCAVCGWRSVMVCSLGSSNAPAAHTAGSAPAALAVTWRRAMAHLWLQIRRCARRLPRRPLAPSLWRRPFAVRRAAGSWRLAHMTCRARIISGTHATPFTHCTTHTSTNGRYHSPLRCQRRSHLACTTPDGRLGQRDEHGHGGSHAWETCMLIQAHVAHRSQCTTLAPPTYLWRPVRGPGGAPRSQTGLLYASHQKTR